MVLGQVGWLLMALVDWWAAVIPRWASAVSLGAIFVTLIMAPWAQTQFLRLVFNILLGAGPLAIGYVLWRGGREGASTGRGRAAR
jgi:hypothetical protein